MCNVTEFIYSITKILPIGDIHSRFTSVVDFHLKPTIVFLGDYVNRGKQSLEAIGLLLVYKTKYPNNFFSSERKSQRLKFFLKKQTNLDSSIPSVSTGITGSEKKCAWAIPKHFFLLVCGFIQVICVHVNVAWISGLGSYLWGFIIACDLASKVELERTAWSFQLHASLNMLVDESVHFPAVLKLLKCLLLASIVRMQSYSYWNQ